MRHHVAPKSPPIEADLQVVRGLETRQPGLGRHRALAKRNIVEAHLECRAAPETETNQL